MDLPKLTHVRVNVRHLAASIDWYERLLGVPARGHWPPQAPTYVHFDLGPTQFALGQYEPAPATGARFNFEVDDVDGQWRRLGEDVDVLEPLMNTPYGTRKFTIRDPDGNELGFVQAQWGVASRVWVPGSSMDGVVISTTPGRLRLFENRWSPKSVGRYRALGPVPG